MHFRVPRQHQKDRRGDGPHPGVPHCPPEDIAPEELADYDLVGFGSGIFTRSFHPALRGFIEGLAQERGPLRRRSFVFATSGFADAGPHRFFRPLVEALDQKGFETVATFSCRGRDTFLPFKPFGGIRKAHPDAGDLERAQEFAQRLREPAGGQ